MKLVIIAVNALEANVVDRNDLPNLTLQDRGRLDVPAELPLHTEVLWPSMITGVSPETHGMTRTSAREWENPALELAAQVGLALVPERYLLPIGKRLQKLGFDRESKSGEAYFEERGIETIFTDTPSVDIDVPGYSDREGTDEVRKLMGHDEYEPRDEQLFLEKINEEFDEKRADLLAALSVDATLFMCYFQALDNLQHVYWTDESFVDEWYERFDEFVGTIRRQLDDEDAVLVVSDHGMRGGAGTKGTHSDHGYYASTVDLDMETVMDLKPAVDSLLRERAEQAAD